MDNKFKEIAEYFRSTEDKIEVNSYNSIDTESMDITLTNEVLNFKSNGNAYLVSHILNNDTDYINIFSFKSAKEFITKYQLLINWEIFTEDGEEKIKRNSISNSTIIANSIRIGDNYEHN